MVNNNGLKAHELLELLLQLNLLKLSVRHCILSVGTTSMPEIL